MLTVVVLYLPEFAVVEREVVAAQPFPCNAECGVFGLPPPAPGDAVAADSPSWKGRTMTTDALSIRCHRHEPEVVVVALAGSAGQSDFLALASRLSEHIDQRLATVVLDLSGVTALHADAMRAVASVRRWLGRRRVALELVINSYAVAKTMQINDPDALTCAWPSLGRALATICGSAAGSPSAALTRGTTS